LQAQLDDARESIRQLNASSAEIRARNVALETDNARLREQLSVIVQGELGRNGAFDHD
jgi:cell division protein FtsB